MSDVTWEPVEPGKNGYIGHASADGAGTTHEWHMINDVLCVEAYRTGKTACMPLPPGTSLCRRKPVTWSQEPPSEEGRYWFAGVITAADTNSRYVGEIYADDQPILVFVSNGRVVYEGIVWRTQHVHGYWLPATVPQPPGEVGP